MAEIEDVTRCAGTRGDDLTCSLGEHRPRCRQQRRIEVALQGITMTDATAGLGQRQPPVHPNHLSPRRTHLHQQFSSADAKVDPRYARSEEHTSELQSQSNLVCRLLLEKKNEI